MKFCYFLFSLVTLLFFLIAFADFTHHFGAAQKMANIVFFLLLAIFIIRVFKFKEDEK